MISDTPVAAADQAETLTDKVRAYLASAQAAAAGGITWAEFGDLMTALIRLVAAALDAVSGMTGEQKRAVAIAAVGALFDTVAVAAVPWATYPLWIAFRPIVRSLLLALAGGVLEQVLQLTRNSPS